MYLQLLLKLVKFLAFVAAHSTAVSAIQCASGIALKYVNNSTGGVVIIDISMPVECEGLCAQGTCRVNIGETARHFGLRNLRTLGQDGGTYNLNGNPPVAVMRGCMAKNGTAITASGNNNNNDIPFGNGTIVGGTECKQVDVCATGVLCNVKPKPSAADRGASSVVAVALPVFVTLAVIVTGF
ncbi:hypothetical protein niasHT_003241 [Heterodera trifolii]|uniref:Uncharacterized protein n=1 Tax=Heterodera trifolii TaxID=157864 RepID=A0ABD2MAE4_9BILA